jgi:hypothetical protein
MLTVVALAACDREESCVEGARRCAASPVWASEFCREGQWVADGGCEAGVCRCVDFDPPTTDVFCICNPGRNRDPVTRGRRRAPRRANG